MTYRVLALTVAACCVQAAPAWGMIDVVYTLGSVTNSASDVVVVKVEKVSKEKGVVIFQQVANLKQGKNLPERMHHQIGRPEGHTKHFQQRVLDWAEPGRAAVVFAYGKNVVVCLGEVWYLGNAIQDGWWKLGYQLQSYEWVYRGSAEKLQDQLAAMMTGKEVIITAAQYDTYRAEWGATDNNLNYRHNVFTTYLQTRTPRIWRIKASLKLNDYFAMMADKPRFVVGSGTGDVAAVPALLDGLKSPDAAARSQAARGLGQIGPEAKAAVAPLAAALKDKDLGVRAAAAQALVRLEQEARPEVKALTEALQNSSPDVRALAAEALGRLAPDAQAAVPALAKALKDSSPGVRWQCADALWRLGPDAKEAVPALVEAMRRPSKEEADGRYRHKVIEALGAMREKGMEAVPALAQLLDSGVAAGDPLQLTLVRALASIGPEARAAVPTLTAKLNCEDNYLRYLVADALGRIDAPARGPRAELFEDNDSLFLAQLSNRIGMKEGREVKDRYSGDKCVRIKEACENYHVRGWRFPIVEKPLEGQYRFLRFAWKKAGGDGIALGLHLEGGKSSYFEAGKPIQYGKRLGNLPTEWTVVTLDLYKEVGKGTLTGLALHPIGGGSALFDHIYLGRTLGDLDATPDKPPQEKTTPAQTTPAK